MSLVVVDEDSGVRVPLKDVLAQWADTQTRPARDEVARLEAEAVQLRGEIGDTQKAIREADRHTGMFRRTLARLLSERAAGPHVSPELVQQIRELVDDFQ